MTGWEIDPGPVDCNARNAAGNWQCRSPRPDAPLKDVATSTVPFERSKDIEITFAPRTTTVIELKLASKGTPYLVAPRSRPSILKM